MTLTKQIITLLKSSRQGMTAHQIHRALPLYEGTKNGLQSHMQCLLRYHHIRIDGRRECEGCGREHVVYRITDHGRIHGDDGLYNTRRVKEKATTIILEDV